MPRRDDLATILVLGSGPIKIGQAAEFDFSGSQAVRALREDGYKVILVNSNPATIQNDPEMADVVYIEPLLPDTVAKILEKERPCALLAGMGGQTAVIGMGHSKPMVLTRDGHDAFDDVNNRLVRPTMPVAHLVGLQS